MSLVPISLRLPARLRQAREHCGWSQRQLGVKMGLDIRVGSARINRYEHGRIKPTLDALERLAQALGVSCAYFVVEDNTEALACLLRSPVARQVAPGIHCPTSAGIARHDPNASPPG